jgi:hypothetical protein
MLALQKAIVAKWQTATAITAKGPWLDVAEDASTYPFGVMSFISGSTKHYFGNRVNSEHLIRLTVFGTGTDPGTAQVALHTRFDNCQMDLSSYGGGYTFHFVRESQSIRYEATDKSGNKVYRADSIYRAKSTPA